MPVLALRHEHELHLLPYQCATRRVVWRKRLIAKKIRVKSVEFHLTVARDPLPFLAVGLDVTGELRRAL